MQTECGLCCAAMVSDYYGHSITLQELREFHQPGRDGITATQLVELFRWLGFDCKIYRCTRNELPAIPLPAVAFWDKSHYVVIEQVKKGRIYLMDPAAGPTICTEEEFDSLFSGLFFCPSPNESFTEKKPSRSILWQYAFLLKRSKWLILAILILSLISYLFSMVIPIMVQSIIDSPATMGNSLLFGGLLALLGYSMTHISSSLLSVLVKTDIYKRFFASAMEKIANAEYRYFKNRSIGGISYNLDCIEVVNDQYSAIMVSSLIAAGAMVILTGYIAFVSLPLFCLVVAMLALVFFALRLQNRRVVLLSQQEISSRSDLRTKQYEFLASIENLKISGSEMLFYHQWEKTFFSAIKKNQSKSYAQTIYAALATIFNLGLPLAILLSAFALVFANALTIGAAISLYSLSTIITSFAISCFSSVNILTELRNYLDRIKDVIAHAPEQSGQREADNIQEICLDHVSFRYDKHSPLVLKDISMRFKRGQKTAIVGTSGCGKSSIAKLLIKLYPPAEGRILYDGVDAGEFENRRLRRVLGSVPQDGYLFNRSVLENITLFCPSYTMDEVDEVCKAMRIYDDIMKMPMKYETLLSDIGSNISGGQKQRLILARSLLARPEFLILDEATSALDSITEQDIYNALKEMGCTQVVIAHRMSTVADADYIYVLKDGQIAEEGTHQQLLALGGEYYALYHAGIKAEDLPLGK